MSECPLIDVRTIPGPQKHPTVFKAFEALAVGQSVTLVNDHDPFPLHDQFKFIKRGQFEWVLLDQGPQVWRVRLTRIANQKNTRPAR